MAEVVADQLRTTTKLSFEDFFPDRQVDIEQRPFMRPSQLPAAPESPMFGGTDEERP
jgi:hypothetical protein